MFQMFWHTTPESNWLNNNKNTYIYINIEFESFSPAKLFRAKYIYSMHTGNQWQKKRRLSSYFFTIYPREALFYAFIHNLTIINSWIKKNVFFLNLQYFKPMIGSDLANLLVARWNFGLQSRLFSLNFLLQCFIRISKNFECTKLADWIKNPIMLSFDPLKSSCSSINGFDYCEYLWMT